MASQILKRGFSMSTVSRSAQVIKTPIQVHGVEGKYAAALYSAASKQNKLDQVDKDLQNIKSVYQDNKQFREFVLDPTLRGLKKKQAVHEIAKKIGTSAETANFLALLAENGRLAKLESVVTSFESIMRAHRGELFVQVTTAEPLNRSHENSLNEVLSQFTKKGQKVTVTYQVKPAIVGGLIINIGDKYVDLSIARKIKHYREAIATAV